MLSSYSCHLRQRRTQVLVITSNVTLRNKHVPGNWKDKKRYDNYDNCNSIVHIYIYTRILFLKTLVSQFKLFEPYTIVFRILLLMQYIEIILNHKQWPSSSCLQCEMQFSRICFSQCMKAAFVYLLIQS